MLKGGTSQLVSDLYGEDMLQSPYKNYSSFDRWQANKDLFSAIYFL
jgi:hypothetical protein